MPRIGDAERQAAVDALSEHFVAGRLNDAEFNERMDAAMQARTAADLWPLFSDLPRLEATGPGTSPESQALVPLMPPYLPVTQPPPAAVPATTAGRGRAQTLQLIRTLVWPVAVVLVIFTGANFWPVVGAAILVSIVVSNLLKAEGAKQLPPGWEPSDDQNGSQPPYGGQPPYGPQPPHTPQPPVDGPDPDDKPRT